MATQRAQEIFTPREASTSTGPEPSAFIATTCQSPSSTPQVSVCWPGPDAWAAQNGWRAGGSGARRPGRGE